jgi:hypothetical protein
MLHDLETDLESLGTSTCQSVSLARQQGQVLDRREIAATPLAAQLILCPLRSGGRDNASSANIMPLLEIDLV